MGGPGRHHRTGRGHGVSRDGAPDRTGPSRPVRDQPTAHLLAFVVIANRRHTDLFEWSQRSTPFTLPAKIQRRLMPASSTCEAGAFTLAAWLEPAADIGGDTFDDSVGRNELYLTMTDAMGHWLASALTETLCVGGLRNSRRQGGTLLEQADAANTALLAQTGVTGSEGFSTGILGRLDLRTDVLAMVNAGHVAPYLARDGTVEAIELPAALPLGLFAEAVVAASGPVLADDAALLMLDWHGGHGRGRSSEAGADPVTVTLD